MICCHTNNNNDNSKSFINEFHTPGQAIAASWLQSSHVKRKTRNSRFLLLDRVNPSDGHERFLNLARCQKFRHGWTRKGSGAYIWSSCLLTSSTSSRSVSSCRTMAPYVSVKSSAFCKPTRPGSSVGGADLRAGGAGGKGSGVWNRAYHALDAGEEGVAGLGRREGRHPAPGSWPAWTSTRWRWCWVREIGEEKATRRRESPARAVALWCGLFFFFWVFWCGLFWLSACCSWALPVYQPIVPFKTKWTTHVPAANAIYRPRCCSGPFFLFFCCCFRSSFLFAFSFLFSVFILFSFFLFILYFFYYFSIPFFSHELFKI